MEYVTIAQAAALLGVSHATVQRRIRSGELPADLVTPRLYMIPRSALAMQTPGRRKPGPKGPRKRVAPTSAKPQSMEGEA